MEFDLRLSPDGFVREETYEWEEHNGCLGAVFLHRNGNNDPDRNNLLPVFGTLGEREKD